MKSRARSLAAFDVMPPPLVQRFLNILRIENIATKYPMNKLITDAKMMMSNQSHQDTIFPIPQAGKQSARSRYVSRLLVGMWHKSRISHLVQVHFAISNRRVRPRG